MISLITKGLINAIPVEYVPSPARGFTVTYTKRVAIEQDKDVNIESSKDFDKSVSRSFTSSYNKSYTIEVD